MPLFFSMTRAEDELPITYFRDGYTGENQVLIDPHGMSEDNTTTVGIRDISDDGKTVVYQVREGGVDEAAGEETEDQAKAELAARRRGLKHPAGSAGEH